MDQYDWKLELPKQIVMFCPVEFQCSFCNDLRDTWKVHLWPYVNQALLWMDMVENQNIPTNVTRNPPNMYVVSTKILDAAF